MEIKETGFEGLVEIIPRVFHDDRGFFLETYRESILNEAGIPTSFVQDNQSFSQKNVIRGLHLQLAPHEQIKMVRVTTGRVLDVVVDVRDGSETFGKHFSCVLDGNEGNSLYIPAGFAHGFAVLEDAVFCYKCSDYYHSESETGIRFDDDDLGIDWGIDDPIVSAKDRMLPTFNEFQRIHDLA